MSRRKEKYKDAGESKGRKMGKGKGRKFYCTDWW